MSQILLVIEKVKLDQCQIDLDFSKFVDLCSAGFMPRYINGVLVYLCSYLPLVVDKKAMWP